MGRWILCPGAGGSDDPPPGADSSQGGTDPHQGRRVLVVEDDWLIAIQIETSLTAAGFAVTGIAADADEALRLAASELPDLVLMDIRLRGPVHGVDLARQLRQRFGLRSLFVSGNIDAAARRAAAPAQPVGWLPKPFTEAELLAAVRRFLGDGGQPPKPDSDRS